MMMFTLQLVFSMAWCSLTLWLFIVITCLAATNFLCMKSTPVLHPIHEYLGNDTVPVPSSFVHYHLVQYIAEDNRNGLSWLL